ERHVAKRPRHPRLVVVAARAGGERLAQRQVGTRMSADPVALGDRGELERERRRHQTTSAKYCSTRRKYTSPPRSRMTTTASDTAAPAPGRGPFASDQRKPSASVTIGLSAKT